MNKTILIAGVLVAVGVGAFFYFRPKAKFGDTAGLGANLTSGGAGTAGAGASTTGASIPPAGTVISTPEQLAEMTKKIEEAKVLVKRIMDLKRQRGKIELTPVTPVSYGTLIPTEYGTGLSITAKMAQISAINKKIKALEQQLQELGYTEVNGTLVRIEKL